MPYRQQIYINSVLCGLKIKHSTMQSSDLTNLQGPRKPPEMLTSVGIWMAAFPTGERQFSGQVGNGKIIGRKLQNMN